MKMVAYFANGQKGPRDSRWELWDYVLVKFFVIDIFFVMYLIDIMYLAPLWRVSLSVHAYCTSTPLRQRPSPETLPSWPTLTKAISSLLYFIDSYTKPTIGRQLTDGDDTHYWSPPAQHWSTQKHWEVPWYLYQQPLAMTSSTRLDSSSPTRQ